MKFREEIFPIIQYFAVSPQIAVNKKCFYVGVWLCLKVANKLISSFMANVSQEQCGIARVFWHRNK
jgi:hypothetical protein